MGTNTTNIALYKPAVGETGWGALVNTDFDSLDTLAGAKVILQTSNAKFPNGQILGALSNGLLKVAAVTGVISTAIPGTDYYATGLSVIPVSDGGTGVATVPSNGQLLIGNGTGYTVASLTAGAGITITPGAGTITIADTGFAAAGGNPTELQYNSAGSLAGDSGIIRTGAGSLSLTNLTLTNDLPVTEGGTGASTAAGARTNLGLGTIAVQDANNVAITGGSIAGTIQIAVANGGTGASIASTARTNLGLGTMAVQDATAVAVTGGSITGITDLAIADGGTGLSTAPVNGQLLIGNGGIWNVSTLTAGVGISIVNSGGGITIADAGGGAGEANTASNVGGGTGDVFFQKTGVNLEFRTLVATGAATVVNNGNFIEIGTSAAVGEANTASNVGTGTGLVFKQKTGVDLEFKRIAAGTGILITNGVSDVTITSTATGRSYTYALMGG